MTAARRRVNQNEITTRIILRKRSPLAAELESDDVEEAATAAELDALRARVADLECDVDDLTSENESLVRGIEDLQDEIAVLEDEAQINTPDEIVAAFDDLGLFDRDRAFTGILEILSRKGLPK